MRDKEPAQNARQGGAGKMRDNRATYKSHEEPAGTTKCDDGRGGGRGTL